MAWATATVLTVVAITASLAAAGVSANAAIQQGKAQEKAAKFNAAVERNNALAAQDQAQFEAAKLRRRNAFLRGAQSAAIGKSGVDLSGSAVDVMNDSAVQGELDALAALYTGKVRANSAQSSAQLFDAQGENARTSSYYSAAGSILGGVSGATGSAAGAYARNR